MSGEFLKDHVIRIPMMPHLVIGLRIHFLCLAFLFPIVFVPNVHAERAYGPSPSSLILVYPGFNDNGSNKVPIMEAVRPGSSAIIVFRERPPSQAYKDNWERKYRKNGGANQVKFLDSQSLKAQGGAIDYLIQLRNQGVSSIMLNIDMDVSHMNFSLPRAREAFVLPLGKGRMEQAWAGKIGAEFSTAHQQVFETSEIGFMAHSYGNGAANYFLKHGGKADFGIMASPGAMRDTLNDLAAHIPNNNLLVLTAEGDFHGQVNYDGPVNFQHVKLLNPKHPHSSMVMMKNLKTAIPHVTNQANLQGRPLIDHLRNMPPSHHQASYSSPTEIEKVPDRGGVELNVGTPETKTEDLKSLREQETETRNPENPLFHDFSR